MVYWPRLERRVKMIEKIKTFAESVKNVMLYIVTPIAFVVGFIYYLIVKNHRLEDELNIKEGEKKLGELKGQQKEIDDRADASSAEYERLKRDYLRGSHQGSGPGDSGQDGSDPNQGS